MAFEYAYGKPDAPLKRSVSLNLSSSNADAVQAAMAKLASAAPDYDIDTTPINSIDPTQPEPEE